VYQTDITISSCAFQGNDGKVEGGAVALNSGSTLTLDAVEFSGGKAGKCPAVQTTKGETSCMTTGATITAEDSCPSFNSDDFCNPPVVIAPMSVPTGDDDDDEARPIIAIQSFPGKTGGFNQVPDDQDGDNMHGACKQCMNRRCSDDRDETAPMCYNSHNFGTAADEQFCMCSCCRNQCGMKRYNFMILLILLTLDYFTICTEPTHPLRGCIGDICGHDRTASGLAPAREKWICDG
jgi:hypothetical protein